MSKTVPATARPLVSRKRRSKAALWPTSVRRLALIAPFGLFDDAEPPTDPWAQRGDAVPGLMCADPEIWKALKAVPEGANSIEWPIEQTRANEAAARIFWPLGNTKLEKRLNLIKAPTLLIWGEDDSFQLIEHAERFAAETGFDPLERGLTVARGTLSFQIAIWLPQPAPP